ncbi:kish-A-like protein [Phlebopus sp. FC_14]|nr:kish-A-like protein [Phlebopus sp. FC_14]
MSALFNFQSLLLVILLLICTCTYVRAVTPRLIDRNKEGILGLFFMSARIGAWHLLWTNRAFCHLKCF